MNRAVVAHGKPPEGERFLPALCGHRRLEAVEFGLVTKAGMFLKTLVPG